MADCSVPTRTTKGGFLTKGRLSARTACSYKTTLAEEPTNKHLPLHYPQRCPLSTQVSTLLTVLTTPDLLNNSHVPLRITSVYRLLLTRKTVSPLKDRHPFLN